MYSPRVQPASLIARRAIFLKVHMIEIQLGDGHVALIDDGDAAVVAGYKWRRSVLGYAVCQEGKKLLLMHRLILSASKGDLVDHANHNTLDNTRGNLRLCTHTQNMQNCKLQKNNQIGLKGVVMEKGRYRARITAFGKRFSLGVFNTPIEAYDAYKKAAKEMHGAFACVN